MQAASYEHIVELRKISALKRSNQEESLEEQAALVLRLPEKMEGINPKLCCKLCCKLCSACQSLQLPSLTPVPDATATLFVPTPKNVRAYILCNMIAMTGDSMGHFYVIKGPKDRAVS